MELVLEKLEELIKGIKQLPKNERAFLADHLGDLSRDLERMRDYRIEDHINLSRLYQESHADNFSQFAFFLLEKCMESDDNRFVSQITSCCHRNLPEEDVIRDLLLQGIFDTTKSNRLRERFFWLFRSQFESATINFYNNAFDEFLKVNQANPELVGDIIDFLTWHTRNEQLNTESVKALIHQFIETNPSVLEKIYSSSVRAMLGYQDE
jgi:hypothetical protein